jgi:sugar lactone lactonase YvrE
MAIDEQENIWLFNKGDDPVQVYTPAGEFVRTWGKGHFQEPHHIRLDHEGHVWVADFGLHVVEKYTPEGKLLQTLGIKGQAGEDERHFNRPTDMVITPAGDIFVTDGYGNRRIVHFDKDGQFVNAWGTYGSKPGEFVLPHAIVVDSKGRLYVADRNSGRIEVFDQDGNFLDQWDNVVMPWGLFITAEDELWVCGSSPHWWMKDAAYIEFKDQIFMRFSTDGRVRQLFTLPLGAEGNVQPGETRGVHCMVVDSKGNVYLGDIYGERAQKFVLVTRRPEEKRE